MRAPNGLADGFAESGLKVDIKMESKMYGNRKETQGLQENAPSGFADGFADRLA